MRGGALEAMLLVVRSPTAASGTPLLAARLAFRVWHAVEAPSDATRLMLSFLTSTLVPGSGAASSSDVQLLCLRMLARMTSHLASLLTTAGGGGGGLAPGRAAPAVSSLC